MTAPRIGIYFASDPITWNSTSELVYLKDLIRRIQPKSVVVLTALTSSATVAKVSKEIGYPVIHPKNKSQFPDVDVLFTWYFPNIYNFISGDIQPNRILDQKILSHYTRNGTRVISRFSDCLFGWKELKDLIDVKMNGTSKAMAAFRKINERELFQLKQITPPDFTDVEFLLNGDPRHSDWCPAPGKRLYLGDNLLFDIVPSRAKHKRQVPTLNNPSFLGYISFSRGRCEHLKALQRTCNLTVYSNAAYPGIDVKVGNYVAGTNYFYKCFGNHTSTINVGKGIGRFAYRGKTIYDANVAGSPVFIAESEDPLHKSFEGLDCYFKSPAHLNELLRTTNLKDLLAAQDEILTADAIRDEELVKSFVETLHTSL